MKNLLLLSLLFILSNVHSQKLADGTIQNKNYYSEIPFEYVRNKIIIPVKIRSEIYRFIFDTGAPNVLNKRLSDLIGSSSKKLVSVSDANNTSSDMKLITIPELTIGSIVFENSTALAFQGEKNLIMDCFQVDGFIGSNLFANSIVQIDLKNKLLRITDDKKILTFEKKNEQKLVLVGAQKSPYFEIKLGKDIIGSCELLFDSGMDGFFDLSNAHYQVFKKHKIFQELSLSKGGEGLGMFGHEATSEQYKLFLEAFKIGKQSFSNLEITTSNDKNSRIGSEFLKYFVVTLNYKNKKIAFDLYPEFNKYEVINLAKTSRKFSLTIIDNKLVVGYIWDENLRTKIKSGDQIISLDTINYENKPICDIMLMEHLSTSDMPIIVTVKTGDGQLITIES